jgi:hypothetical protein
VVITRDFDSSPSRNPGSNPGSTSRFSPISSWMSTQSLPHASYIASYRGHLAFTQDHLAGVDDSAPSSSSSGYWTPTEKNLFFHALSIHSRLRPDLIAACIPTKTIVDVCMYVDVLETAAAEGPPLQRGELRRALPCAMEVSDRWIKREEEGSAWLAAVEHTWAREAILAARTGEIEKAREGDEPRQLGTDGDGLENRTKERETRWRKEDLLDRLGEIHLNVIDSIIQAADEKNTGKRKRSENDVGDAGLSVLIVSLYTLAHAVGRYNLSSGPLPDFSGF